eukprot:221107-Prymnesium_polylepis.1
MTVTPKSPSRSQETTSITTLLAFDEYLPVAHPDGISRKSPGCSARSASCSSMDASLITKATRSSWSLVRASWSFSSIWAAFSNADAMRRSRTSSSPPARVSACTFSFFEMTSIVAASAGFSSPEASATPPSSQVSSYPRRPTIA